MISTLKLFREVTDDCIYPDAQGEHRVLTCYTMYSAFMDALGVRFYEKEGPDAKALLYFSKEQEQISLFDVVSTHLSFMNLVMDGGKEAVPLFDNTITEANRS